MADDAARDLHPLDKRAVRDGVNGPQQNLTVTDGGASSHVVLLVLIVALLFSDIWRGLNAFANRPTRKQAS
jgi:hypothetical protein